MDIDAYRKRLQERARANRLAFEGQYREEIEGYWDFLVRNSIGSLPTLLTLKSMIN